MRRCRAITLVKAGMKRGPQTKTNGAGNMNRVHRVMVAALAVALAAGGASAFAKGKKHQGSSTVSSATAPTTVATGSSVGKKHHQHHPHGIVKAVGSGSITIEKVKKHKTKTFKVSPNVVVEKKHGKKHGSKAQGAVSAKPSKKSGKHAHNGGKGQLSEVKVGDHVKLTLEGKQVVKIEVKHAKKHKQGKGAKAGKSHGKGT